MSTPSSLDQHDTPEHQGAVDDVDAVDAVDEAGQVPENPPPRAWVTLALFAGFIVVVAGYSGIWGIF